MRAADAMAYNPEAYLSDAFTARGIGTWYKLYLRFLEDDPDIEILDIGAGSPDFLKAVSARRRMALDVSDLFRADFESAGIGFCKADIERDPIDDLGRFDVIICSDVFEHLVSPQVALDKIARALRPEGVLFAHVPNEFRLGHMVRVMLGRTESLRFHRNQEEWTDPHLRRFTEVGFRKFLGTAFRFNLRLHDLKYGRRNRFLQRLLGDVPYCLQPGPTYVSTNSEAAWTRYCQLKRRLALAGRK